MIWIALKMLMEDRSKYFAIIFGVSFACFLIASAGFAISQPFWTHGGGAGMVEPSTEASVKGYIAVGTQLGGLVTQVHARIGQDVKKGQTFVRLEPYVMPKTSLTGANIERVETRVVQLVYAIDPENKLVREKKVLVGQLLDVFIDTRSNSSDSK